MAVAAVIDRREKINVSSLVGERRRWREEGQQIDRAGEERRRRRERERSRRWRENVRRGKRHFVRLLSAVYYNIQEDTETVIQLRLHAPIGRLFVYLYISCGSTLLYRPWTGCVLSNANEHFFTLYGWVYGYGADPKRSRASEQAARVWFETFFNVLISFWFETRRIAKKKKKNYYSIQKNTQTADEIQKVVVDSKHDWKNSYIFFLFSNLGKFKSLLLINI